MFIKIFKTVTSVLLVGVLAFLISKRDIQTFIRQKTSNSISSPTKILERPTSQETLTPTKVHEVSNPQLHTVTIPTAPVETQAEQIKPTTKSTLYVPLETGKADNDESYKPSTSICKTTTGYKIGSFDTRFGISKENFIQEINKGSALWSAVTGTTLFSYNEQGPLTINLIYDERQARTVDIGYLALDIENAKQNADALKQKYEQEKITYTQDGDQFTKDSATFQERYNAYQAKVTMYNNQGGAPRGEYNSMMSELEALKAESASLESRRQALLAQMDAINKEVARYNEFIVYINGLIQQSNSIGGQKLTEGRFNPNTNTIDIYQYTDNVKLLRVLTHELGHALGINHTKNPQSIMYAVNSSTSTVLSKEDIVAMKDICNN